jgi:hypothetical protein
LTPHNFVIMTECSCKMKRNGCERKIGGRLVTLYAAFTCRN